MDDVAGAAKQIAGFLQSFASNGGLRLRFRVKLRGGKQSPDGAGASESGDPDGTASAEDARTLYVEFTGPDTRVLTAHNGEVLDALEHIATKILRLEPDAHDQVSFDADHFKANRDRQMRESAAAAIEHVQATGRPYSFPAMGSRERRSLHLILSESGLATASSGEGAGRFVVLYPAGADTSLSPAAPEADRRHSANRIRENFRHR
jgi:spoIIIJ-associated protein